jgi:hypothetical protein
MKKILICLMVLLLGAPVFAQEFDYDVFVGGGVLASEVPDWGDLFASAQIKGLQLPFEASSGVAAEIFKDGDWLSMPGFNLWNTNRVNVPMVNGLYGGSDLKFITRAGDDTRWDFDLRLVTGYKINPKLKAEAYFLEDDKFVAVNVLYNADLSDLKFW